jgi:hypothetical protein
LEGAFSFSFSRFRATRDIKRDWFKKLLLPWILKYIKIYFLFLSLWMHVSKAQPNPTTYCILSKQAIGEAMLFEASKKSSLLISTYLFVEYIQSFRRRVSCCQFV